MKLKNLVEEFVAFCICFVQGIVGKRRKENVKKSGNVRMSRVRRDDDQSTFHKELIKRKTEIPVAGGENDEENAKISFGSVLDKHARRDDDQSTINEELLKCKVEAPLAGGDNEDENIKISFGNVLDKQASDTVLEAFRKCGTPKDQQVLSRKERKRKQKQEKALKAVSKQLCTVSDKKSKVFSPLPLYFNFKPEDIYNRLQSYVLTEEQLQWNDFPKESSEHPGYVLNKCCSTPSTHPERHCTRCGEIFRVVEGQYSSQTVCNFHPKKITSLNGVPAAGTYLCCAGNFLADPCTERAFHVSAERFLADVPFRRVRRKREVRQGQRRSVYALDCEMSYTTAGIEVTRVGVVGADGLTVYEAHVLPDNPVLDLNTEFSGVTEQHLQKATATLGDVHAVLLTLLHEESVLVGHAVHNDLFALRLLHDRVVDTSVVYPHPFGGRHGSSLKFLANAHLKKVIQEGVHGHDCIEDARTSMELMLLKIKSVTDRQ